MNVFINEYLTILKLEKNLSDNTISSYKNDLLTFFKFISEYKINDPSEIKADHIRKFFNSLKDIGLTSTSSARYFSSLKDFSAIFLKIII